MTDRQEFEARARDLGFDRIGVAAAEPLVREGARLDEWMRRGYQATMGWMERTAEKRKNPRLLLPGARSVIALAMNYYAPGVHREGQARVSRYAWGDDYHDVFGERLRWLLAWLGEFHPGVRSMSNVDAGPVMDKVWAERAGIGWIGKHTNVITRSHGSWVFLGEILTTLELEPDPPATDHCGSCTRCIDACPTEAIVEPYVVDSRRCLSYLTIEHRGPIDGEIRRQFEGWVFGCDTCQDVCPWNTRFARTTGEAAFFPRDGAVTPDLRELRALSPEEFRERFKSSPILRARYDGLMRNIDIVRGADTDAGPGASNGRGQGGSAGGEGALPGEGD